ncbi:hypothetical protein [Sorangium sp. So ce394]|uniref:hypothetical protein n=1 Tax=Sorangium sp. So ce394 TaxID=3133310 RepID=UPI003F5B870F
MERFRATVERFRATVERFRATVERFRATVERFRATVERFRATVGWMGTALEGQHAPHEVLRPIPCAHGSLTSAERPRSAAGAERIIDGKELQ